MEFGLPKVKSQKQEKYENVGVLTFMPTGPGLGRKMVFNGKASELLGLDDNQNKISFSFSGKEIYIVNTSKSGVSGLNVSKGTKSISDKKHYEYIKYTINNSSEKDELELFLLETEQVYMDNKVFLLSAVAPEVTNEKEKENGLEVESQQEPTQDNDAVDMGQALETTVVDANILIEDNQ